MQRNVNVRYGTGVGVGTVLAIILSWTVNHSILWCILHAICGWFYVIYWAITY
jgi:p-aminobenzoyl-glutamate transporter AbgT